MVEPRVGNPLRVAVEVRKKFGTSNPRLIAEKCGIKIVESGGGRFGNLIKFSDYSPKDKKITLYSEFPQGVSVPSKEERIAHELFHHFCPGESREEDASDFARKLLAQ